MLVVNGSVKKMSAKCCSSTSTDVRITLLLAKMINRQIIFILAE